MKTVVLCKDCEFVIKISGRPTCKLHRKALRTDGNSNAGVRLKDCDKRIYMYSDSGEMFMELRRRVRYNGKTPTLDGYEYLAYRNPHYGSEKWEKLPQSDDVIERQIQLFGRNK